MAGTTINPYRFGGQVGYRRDAPTRQYVRARHLDTGKGRWVSRDPIDPDDFDPDDADANLFAYGLNDPIGSLDPDGLRTRRGGRRPNPAAPPVPPIPSPCRDVHDLDTCVACCKAQQAQPPGGRKPGKNFLPSCLKDCNEKYTKAGLRPFPPIHTKPPKGPLPPIHHITCGNDSGGTVPKWRCCMGQIA